MSALLAEAKAYVADESSVSATDFPLDTELKAGQKVDWVSSTFDGFHLINVFAVIEQNSGTRFLALSHGNDGIVECVDGPFNSLDAAEAYYTTQEGWTRL